MKYGITGTLGGRIVSEMKTAGYPTIAHLARAIGRDRKAVQNWIDGTARPYDTTLEILAEKLCVPKEWLKHGGEEDVAQLIAENDALHKRIDILNQMIKAFLGSDPTEVNGKG